MKTADILFRALSDIARAAGSDPRGLSEQLGGEIDRLRALPGLAVPVGADEVYEFLIRRIGGVCAMAGVDGMMLAKRLAVEVCKPRAVAWASGSHADMIQQQG